MRVLMAAALLVAAVPALAEGPVPPGAGVPSGVVAGETKAARLDALFDALQAAPTEAAGKTIERQILVEWHSSGDAGIDRLFRTAMLAMDIRAFSAAIKVLDRIVAEKPDFAEGWNKRATVYYYVDQYDRSLADIERTLALEPRHFGALAGLGMIMQDTGNLPGAVAAFEQAVSVNPSLTNLKRAIEQLNAKIGRDI
jgi:tetratricopeptide (TPR) repeat protein